MRGVLLCVLVGVLSACGTVAAEERGILTTRRPTDEVAISWVSGSGYEVQLTPPRLTATNPGDGSSLPITLALTSHSLKRNIASLAYALRLELNARHIDGNCRMTVDLPEGTTNDLLLCDIQIKFDQPVRCEVVAKYDVHIVDASAGQMVLPQCDGYVSTCPFSKGGKEAHFFLGHGSAGGGTRLALPAVGLEFDKSLAIATDPYCGTAFRAKCENRGPRAGTRLTITTQYTGSLVPLVSERRKIALQFHASAIDGTLRNFYRTIPEIEPAPTWVHDIQLNYYDYISNLGEGWYKDVDTLAKKIPKIHRGKVICCLHGYYDYLGHYCYDHETGKLAPTWDSYDYKARKVPMSIEEVHKRIKFAKDRGFRVAYYFADGPSSDNSSPYYRKDWVIKDGSGRLATRGFWQWRPDTKGKKPVNHILDPGNPAVRNWWLDYTKALLEEYGKELDALVWDETFLIPLGVVSTTGDTPTYSDREMMRLTGEISQLVQKARVENPALVFLTSDNGHVPYALTAHGTYQDSACRPQTWPPSMLPAYRNCLWSCNWYPVTGAANNRFAAEEYGIAQGVSNGWGNDAGPHEMPKEVLDAVIARFIKRSEDGADRTRFLVREPVIVPGSKEGNIAGKAQVTASSEYDYESADNFRAAGAIDGVVDGYPSDMTAEWAPCRMAVTRCAWGWIAPGAVVTGGKSEERRCSGGRSNPT